MVTTSDGIWSPDPGDNYDLTVDFAAHSSSEQAALERRSGQVGSTAERNAFGVASARPGVTWFDTTENALYIWDGSTWRRVAPGTDTGWVNLNVNRNGFSAVSDRPPQYRLRDGVVWLRGDVGRNSAPTSNLVFATLPNTARPSATVYAQTIDYGSGADSVLVNVTITTGGEIQIKSAATRPASSLPAYPISGISFLAS